MRVKTSKASGIPLFSALPGLPPIPSLPPLPLLPPLPSLPSLGGRQRELRVSPVAPLPDVARRLDEAQRYLDAGDVEAAVSKVGPVFEHALRTRYETDEQLTLDELIDASSVDGLTKERWHRWRHLRNEIAHEVSPGANVRLAREMLEGVRRLVS